LPNYFQAISFFHYWLNAVGEHSLQSPFIYDFYQNVINKKPERHLQFIKAVRNQLAKSEQTIVEEDWGAASLINQGNDKRIADIAKYGVTKSKFGNLLYRLINFTDSKHIVELGTSLGIGSLYLSANPTTHLTTFEGSDKLLNIAESVFEAHNKSNITTVLGNINTTLPHYLQNVKKLDFVYFDANHTKEATLNYFELCLKNAHDKSCFVFDDIHWSKEMQDAWKTIKAHYQVTISIDLFQLGIIFINPEMTKQHFIIEY